MCKNFFKVTDREAVKSFFGNKNCGTVVQKINSNKDNASSNKSGIQRTPLTCLLRDIVWNFGRWKNKRFWNWIEEFSPELIFLQIGDSSFMPELALKISKRFNAPIAFYCTENYYFKKHNYFPVAGGNKHGIFYPVFRYGLVRSFKKLMKKSCCQIYNSKQLERLYFDEFGKQGHVIYQSSSIKTFQKRINNGTPKFSYMGNLGLKRHESIIEIASALQSISVEYSLDVYGNACDDVVKVLQKTPGIVYHGVVGYDKVVKVIENSDFLFHAESFDEFIVKDLETAFSTKISDSLASGRCFVLYADESLTCSRYLIENECACVITHPGELLEKLKELIENESFQHKITENAIRIAAVNHDVLKNSKEFQNVLRSSI